MSKKEKENEIVEEADELDAEDVEVETKTSKASSAQTAFKALIEAYKKRNPVKYALKRAELEKKLANL